MIEWESASSSDDRECGVRTQIAWVVTGWLVRIVRTVNYEIVEIGGLTFIPDENHKIKF